MTIDLLHAALCDEIARLSFETQRLRLAVQHLRQADFANKENQRLLLEDERRKQAEREAEAKAQRLRKIEDERKDNKVDSLVKKILNKANSALEFSEVKKPKIPPKLVKAPQPILLQTSPKKTAALEISERPDFDKLQTAVTTMKRKIFGISDFAVRKVDAKTQRWAAEMFEDADENPEISCAVGNLLDALLAKQAPFEAEDLRVVQTIFHFLENGRGGLVSFYN